MPAISSARRSAEYRVQGRGGKGRSGMATRDEDFVTSLFVASTHAPMLFFSSTGMAYKLKVWRLPEARIRARARRWSICCRWRKASASPPSCRCRKTRAKWEKLNVVFATKSGDVRRNELSDFVSINRNGKIAMKLEPGDGIVGVQICTEQDDVLLTTARRQVHPLPGDRRARVQGPRIPPACAASSWPRATKWSACRLLHHSDATHRRGARLSEAGQRRAPRRAGEEDGPVEEPAEDAEEGGEEATLSPERYAELGAREQFVLAVSRERLRQAHQSPMNIASPAAAARASSPWAWARRTAPSIAAFPVEETDDLMLITDQGQTIRVRGGRHLASRAAPPRASRVFRLDEGERVVSVERIADVSGDGGEHETAQSRSRARRVGLYPGTFDPVTWAISTSSSAR